MNVSSIIDTVCVYLNSITSLFTTLQRIKNELHTNAVDYPSLILRLISQPRVEVSQLGIEADIDVELYERALLAAFVSNAVYGSPAHDDWTAGFTDSLNRCLPGRGRRRAKEIALDPCQIDSDSDQEQAGHAASKGRGQSGWRRGALRPIVIDLRESHYMTSSKAQVYMACRDDTVILSLPGTNSRTDWLSNLHSSVTDLEMWDSSSDSTSEDTPKSRKRRKRQGSDTSSKRTRKIHAGFHYIATCLYTHAEIIRYLDLAASRGIRKMLLCGHSQAGAVVSLLSVLLRRRFGDRYSSIRVVTFGSGACIANHRPITRSTVSFVRAIDKGRHHDDLAEVGRRGWQCDPVPLLDDSLLSSRFSAPSGDAAGNNHGGDDREDDATGPTVMVPMGEIYTLLDARSSCSARRLEPGQIRSLANSVLLDFSAEPHGMKGYLRCLILLGRRFAAAAAAPPSRDQADARDGDEDASERDDGRVPDLLTLGPGGSFDDDDEDDDERLVERQLARRPVPRSSEQFSSASSGDDDDDVSQRIDSSPVKRRRRRRRH